MRKISLRIVAAFILCFFTAPPVFAHVCEMCPGDCGAAAEVLKSHHEKGEKDIIKDWQKYPNIVQRMTQHKFWTVSDFFQQQWLPKLMLMATQVSSAAMEQVRLAGTLFDAKQLLETNRMVQELQVQANKDYHPSESFCWVGTNIRSLAESENRGKFNQAALSEMQMTRQLGNGGVGSSEDGEDLDARWSKFRSTYCDVQDNNWYGAGSGLQLACGSGGGDPQRINRDIDYTRLVDVPRTLGIDFQDATATPEEEDVIALSNNLYGHRTPTRKIEGLHLDDSGAQPFYLELRSVMAKRAVAQESFDAIVGLKAEAETEGNTSKFMGAIARDAGLDPADIQAYLGQKPSTYAQLEVLAQKMFQNPNFFVTLYDKPANVKRKKAALNAVDLMLDRYLFESELRQEMLLSVLLSASGKKEFDNAFENIQRQNQQQ